ncbi:hypothetical protein chiPu_0010594 [Chiloscyllium punctatum]|uniref:Uncharacterized protein n=1 Tax=Chiloscyllium punctatum TaxID=137246 RepID=A0A401SP11_CHIPU|nr:hypothetical protein [Chiloscyllium punctatum]
MINISILASNRKLALRDFTRGTGHLLTWPEWNNSDDSFPPPPQSLSSSLWYRILSLAKQTREWLDGISKRHGYQMEAKFSLYLSRLNLACEWGKSQSELVFVGAPQHNPSPAPLDLSVTPQSSISCWNTYTELEHSLTRKGREFYLKQEDTVL